MMSSDWCLLNELHTFPSFPSLRRSDSELNPKQREHFRSCADLHSRLARSVTAFITKLRWHPRLARSSQAERRHCSQR